MAGVRAILPAAGLAAADIAHRHPRHDAGHQRGDRAQGRAHRAAHHAGLPRRARDGQREPLRPVRPEHRAAASRWCRGICACRCRNGWTTRATCCCRWTTAAVRALVPMLRARGRRKHRRRLPARLRQPGARAARARRSWPRSCRTCRCRCRREVSPEMREWERFSTTVANAYVQPLMARYLRRLEDGLRGLGVAAPMFLMLSGGGLTTIETACRFPIRLVESGPAGGAIFSAHIARQCGHRQRAVVRHGRHDGEDLPDRRLPAADRAQLRGRAGRAVPQGLRPAAAHSGDRDGGDRRRRRLDRACRRDGADRGGAGKRRRRSGSGLLRPRRHARRR